MPALLLAAVPAQAGDRAELFGRGYVSTTVLSDGERHPLFERAKVRVDFDHGAEYDEVSWRAECNIFVARVDIADARLQIGQIAGTEVGCAKPQMRQDRWMLRFFGSDPKWRIRHADTLKLVAGDRVIRLRRRA